MASGAVDKYITKRYRRWLDYSVYHCGLSGIPNEAEDVLNEVILQLLQKDSDMLDVLVKKRKGKYTELDFFVLKMIKLNASSLTSPYRSKYKSFLADANIDYLMLEIEDIEEEQEDKSEEILRKMHIIRQALEELDLSPLARKIFEYRFFHGLNFSDWEGPETLKQLYEIFNGVQEMIRKKINGESLL